MATKYKIVMGNITASLFPFERDFEPEKGVQWFAEKWHYSLWYSALYLLFVFGGSRYMQNRAHFKLRTPLAMWSGALAFFSILGAVRTAPEVYHSLFKRSFQYSVCIPSFQYEPPSSFWLFLFVHAKALELGDTVFIVLRKQQLIFLHWYHHITVLIYCYYSLGQDIGPARYFCFINFTIHSLMYSYYALKALKFPVPKWINVVITLLQLFQMMVGVFINFMIVVYQSKGLMCNLSTLIVMTFIMYGSYFVLFAHFFHTAYMKPKTSKSVYMANGRKQE